VRGAALAVTVIAAASGTAYSWRSLHAEPAAAVTPRAAASGATPSKKPRRPYVVAAIGDSLTDFASHGGGYLKVLAKRCPGSRFESFGKGGDMVNQMRRRFAHDVFGDAPPGRPSPYTHVIVFGGVNDLYSDLTAGRTVSKITRDLGEMYDAAHARGASVIAITVTPWGGFTRYFTEARAQTTAELNGWIVGQRGGRVDFTVDAFPLLSCGQKDSLCPEYARPFTDGLHFGPEGHARLGDALYQTVFSDCM
jgi:lysophospholipase L1-like esterase